MSILKVALLLGALAFEQSEASCGACNKNSGVACVREKEFQICVDNKPFPKQNFTCPNEGEVCTNFGTVCVDLSGGSTLKASCSSESKCDNCVGRTDLEFTCSSSTTFTRCSGQELSSEKGECPEGLWCVPGENPCQDRCAYEEVLGDTCDREVEIPDPSSPDPEITPEPGSPDPGTTLEPESPDPGTTLEPESPDPGISPEPGSPDPGITPEPGSPDPGISPEPGSPDPGITPEPGSPDPGISPEPGSPDPGITPEPGSPDPGISPEPGSPDPGITPEPGSPDPGSPDPGSPDPGTPELTPTEVCLGENNAIGRFSYPNDTKCINYVNCFMRNNVYTALSLTCPTGLHFNRDIQSCQEVKPVWCT